MRGVPVLLVHVCREEGLEGKAAAAVAARVRLDGGVLGAHVRLERHLGVEHVVAVLAAVLDVLVLGLDVLHEGALEREGLVALAAPERLLASVEALVVLKEESRLTNFVHK
jgi:hypothetical protein